ncbi:MAG: hypothetical protein LQ350_001320 [Teloschistes chrysophthalmus]|nr:MAG: hypothetical protein LQ350_001320 [Niorma chrysophthalma]
MPMKEHLEGPEGLNQSDVNKYEMEYLGEIPFVVLGDFIEHVATVADPWMKKRSVAQRQELKANESLQEIVRKILAWKYLEKKFFAPVAASELVTQDQPPATLGLLHKRLARARAINKYEAQKVVDVMFLGETGRKAIDFSKW